MRPPPRSLSSHSLWGFPRLVKNKQEKHKHSGHEEKRADRSYAPVRLHLTYLDRSFAIGNLHVLQTEFAFYIDIDICFTKKTHVYTQSWHVHHRLFTFSSNKNQGFHRKTFSRLSNTVVCDVSLLINTYLVFGFPPWFPYAFTFC